MNGSHVQACKQYTVVFSGLVPADLYFDGPKVVTSSKHERWREWLKATCR